MFSLPLKFSLYGLSSVYQINIAVGILIDINIAPVKLTFKYLVRIKNKYISHTVTFKNLSATMYPTISYSITTTIFLTLYSLIGSQAGKETFCIGLVHRLLKIT